MKFWQPDTALPLIVGIDQGGVTVKIFAEFNLEDYTEEAAVAAFTNTWHNAVEQLREKAREVSRLYKDKGGTGEDQAPMAEM